MLQSVPTHSGRLPYGSRIAYRRSAVSTSREYDMLRADMVTASSWEGYCMEERGEEYCRVGRGGIL